MAISIEQEPSNTLYVPINNPVEYLVSSTSTSQNNFKLSCKIVVNGTEVKELKYDVIPSTAYVIAEIQRILQGFASDGEENLVNEESEAKIETDMKDTARAVFQEWYSSSTTSNPTYQGTQASGAVFYIWNGAFKYREWQNNDWHQYSVDARPSVQGSTKALTAFTNYRSGFTTSGSSGFPITDLSAADKFKKITPTQLSRLVWLMYDVSGSHQFIAYYTFYAPDFSAAANNPYGADILNSNTYIANVVNGFNVVSKNFDLDKLKTSSNYNFTSNQLTTINDTSVKYFSVYLTSALYSETVAYLYEIDWNACSKYDSYEIHWLNHLGGWDSWVFDKRSDKQIITQRDWYTQPVTRRIVSDTIIHDSYARKKKQYYTEISERYTINSGILKDWEYDGLIDLLQSPKVYWRHPDYGFIAINILEKETIQVPRQVNEKAYNLNFVFEIDNQDKLQGQ
jgi:hypothetical protein